jgi:ankyrin repeat protein
MFHSPPSFLAKLESEGKTASALPPDQRAFLDAAKRGDVNQVRELLAKGVPVDTREDFDMPCEQTALMYAARNGCLEVVEVLLKAGASVAAVDKNAGDSEGTNTALHHAITSEDLAVLEALLNAGADANALTTSRNTPLNHAIRFNHSRAARLLLKRGVRLGSKIGRKQARSPLCAAVDATWHKVPVEAIKD